MNVVRSFFVRRPRHDTLLSSADNIGMRVRPSS